VHADGGFAVDLRAHDGAVNENVFAYSNAHGEDRVLVVYNNSVERAAGTIERTAPIATASGVTESTVHDELRLSDNPSSFLVYQDQRSGMWFVHRSERVSERGLPIVVDGYGVAVFWNVHERIDDESGRLGRLADELDGAGVPDIEGALAGLAVEPVRSAFRVVATPTLVAELDEAMQGHRPLEDTRFAQIRSDYRAVLERAASISSVIQPIGKGLTSLERHLSTLVSLPHHADGRTGSTRFKRARGHYYTGIRANIDRRRLLTEWTLLVPLVDVIGADEAISWGVDTWTAGSKRKTMLRAGLRRSDWASTITEPAALIRDLLTSSDILEIIGFHTHTGIEYYHLESMEEVLWWLFAIATIRLMSTSTLGGGTVRDQVERAYRLIQQVEAANATARGRADRFMMSGRGSAAPPGRSKGGRQA